jgi:hypothetical protein
MHFSLPSELQKQLIAYDPNLKHLAKEKPVTTKNKPKFPFGKIVGLIPEDIVSTEEFDAAVEGINSRSAEYRYSVFRKDSTTKAILVYFENVWYAWWLPQVKDADYIFGYSYAYRNTPSSIEKCPRSIVQNTNYITEIQCGKAKFIKHQRYITLDYLKNISDSTRNCLLRPANFFRFHQKSTHMYEHGCKVFQDQLSSTIPYWEDSSHPFERLLTTSVIDLAKSKGHFVKNFKELTSQELINVIKLSEADITTPQTHRLLSNGWELVNYKKILHIIDTPYFRSWIQTKFNESINQFKTAIVKQSILNPLNQVSRLLERISFINELWPECPIDYYRTHIDVITEIQSIYVSVSYCNDAKNWLGLNMPVASFFNIITKLREQNRQWSKREETFVFSISEFMDSMRMLQDLLHNNIEVTPPKRWRLTEFHDYLMAETWKIKNENIQLPQDLFPSPISTTISDTKLTFFQPIDTHQLSQWGQAVRNCVGSANNYANGIKKKQHFIVLGTVNNNPQFTVQLTLKNGVLNVEQIKSICNKALTDEEETMYSMGFTDALHKRNAELQSAT